MCAKVCVGVVLLFLPFLFPLALLYQGCMLGLAKVHRVVHVVLEIHRQRFVDYPLRLQAVRVRMLAVAVVEVAVATLLTTLLLLLLALATEPVPVRRRGRFRFAAKDRYQLAVLGGKMAITLVHLAVACGYLGGGEKEGNKRKSNKFVDSSGGLTWGHVGTHERTRPVEPQ